MLDHIVEQTNIYGQQYTDATTLPSHSRVHGWNNDRDELKFLAIIITMGLVKYPHVEDYCVTLALCYTYYLPYLRGVPRILYGGFLSSCAQKI